MRRASLLVLTLALAGCGYKIADCDQPSRNFDFDIDITEKYSEALVLETEVLTPDQLDCDLVCESHYLDVNPDGGLERIDDCELTIDGDFTGTPDNVVGTLRCNGRGTPQFCVEG